MSIPRRGSRSIEVDGIEFSWRIRRRPTPDQRSGKTPLILAVAAARGDGPAMIVRVQAHPRNEASKRSYAVTPGHVAGYIREAIRDGWRPLDPGPQFELQHPNLRISGSSRIVPAEHRPLTPAQLEALAAAPRPRDQLRLRLAPAIAWPGGGGYQPCALEINGVSLIELVRAVERPLVDAEIAERRARGDDLPAGFDIAGQYLGLSAREYRLPNRLLLGEVPSWEASCFTLPEDDPCQVKTTLLTCTCGISECWFLLATIDVLDDVVVWSGFEQFHRHWLYDLGPFVFDKRAYLDAIA